MHELRGWGTYLVAAWNGVSTSFTSVAEVVAELTPVRSCGLLEARKESAKGLGGRWILRLCSGGGELQKGGLCRSGCSTKDGWLGWFCSWVAWVLLQMVADSEENCGLGRWSHRLLGVREARGMSGEGRGHARGSPKVLVSGGDRSEKKRERERG